MSIWGCLVWGYLPKDQLYLWECIFDEFLIIVCDENNIAKNIKDKDEIIMRIKQIIEIGSIDSNYSKTVVISFGKIDKLSDNIY